MAIFLTFILRDLVQVAQDSCALKEQREKLSQRGRCQGCGNTT